MRRILARASIEIFYNGERGFSNRVRRTGNTLRRGIWLGHALGFERTYRRFLSLREMIKESPLVDRSLSIGEVEIDAKGRCRDIPDKKKIRDEYVMMSEEIDRIEQETNLTMESFNCEKGVALKPLKRTVDYAISICLTVGFTSICAVGGGIKDAILGLLTGVLISTAMLWVTRDKRLRGEEREDAIRVIERIFAITRETIEQMKETAGNYLNQAERL